MITLKIKDIETKTGKIVRQEAISVGIDTAPAYTGITILRTDKENIYIEEQIVIASDKNEDYFHKIDHFVCGIEKFKQRLNKYTGFKILIIEKCFYGDNVDVLIQLAQFGILAYDRLRKDFDENFYYGATTARSIIKFNQKKQQEKTKINPGSYTRDTFKKNGSPLHKKGEKKKIVCKELVHDYLLTDFGLTFESKDVADAFVLALSGLLK